MGDSGAEAIARERDQLRRDLDELRAALCHALRMIRREPVDPHDMKVPSPASDREILDEVHRLRKLADRHGAS